MHPSDGYNVRTPFADAYDRATAEVRRRWFRRAWDAAFNGGPIMGVSVTEHMIDHSPGTPMGEFAALTYQVDTAGLWLVPTDLNEAARLARDWRRSRHRLEARERALRLETK